MAALTAAFVLVAALVALLVQAEIGAAEIIDEAETALWWLAAALLGGALALLAWWLERRATAAREAAARAAEREALAERHQRELEAERERLAAQLEHERERLEAELESARGLHTAKLRERDQEIARMRDEVADRERQIAEAKDRAARFSRQDERDREANRELRRQITQLQHERGSLGDWNDIRSLVLKTTMTLAEADKGLLLVRNGDADRLAVAAHEGFDADPSESALAQRFGGEVLERDQIVREDTPEDEPESDDSGADREIDNLVAVPIYVRDEFSGVVVCANRREGFEELDDEVLLALGDHAGAALHNQQLHDELRRSYVSTIRMLAEAIQAKDPFLRGHSEEVSDYVAAVASRLGLDGQVREQLIVGSLLHDLGKIGISERILHKPTALTAEEFAVIQLHPRIGYRLIEQVSSLQPIAPAILHHHERYDGNGYPTGLRGEQIPLHARIVCVADAFSAMTADRPYRARMSLDAACEELERHAGTQFDPEIVRIFVEEVRKNPSEGEDVLASALDDAELQVHREPDEPVLGAGALALTDSVTLLYSHRYLHEAAAAEAGRAEVQDRPFTVLLAHIDEVEHVNEVDGYAAGDAHLRSCARSLSRLAVRLGATACREGGLTLALLVPADRPAEPDVLAREAREALRDCGSARVAVEAWRPGDSGDSVIERARAGLVTRAQPTP